MWTGLVCSKNFEFLFYDGISAGTRMFPLGVHEIVDADSFDIL